MKKKIVMALACAVLMLATAFGFAACGNGSGVTDRIKMDKDAQGTGAGITAAKEGNYIGMGSSEAKEADKAVLNYITVCKDAIAVIVNKGNAADTLTVAELKGIYNKEITEFPGTSTQIVAISRDSASGTRTAFEELVGLKGVNYTTDEEYNSTSLVQTSVKNNNKAIGYISYGSLDQGLVKDLKIENVSCTIENVKNNSYKMQRPFLLCYSKTRTLSAIEKDFLENFIPSKQAQEVIAAEKFVSVTENAKSYVKTEGMSGTLYLRGSTSVDPLMDLLFAKYLELNQ